MYYSLLYHFKYRRLTIHFHLTERQLFVVSGHMNKNITSLCAGAAVTFHNAPVTRRRAGVCAVAVQFGGEIVADVG